MNKASSSESHSEDVEGEDSPVTDTRSPLARGLHRVTEIITISLSFAILIAAGAWLDRKFDTGLVFTILLFLFGALAAGIQLRRLILELEKASAN